MAERATKLQWKERGGGWRAFAVPLELSAELGDGTVFWDFGLIGGNTEDNGEVDVTDGVDALLAAQLAAEDAALTWLREGVEALGGRTLTGEQVALVVEALRLSADMHERMSRVIGDEREVRGKAALSLAKELAG